MTTKDYQNKRPLMIFLNYFKNHLGLFALDVTCAVMIAAIDLAFPLITRTALYEWLPEGQYRFFFTIMIVVACCYALRAFLQFIVAFSVIPSASGWRQTSGLTCSNICRS